MTLNLMYNIGYQKVDNFFYTAQKINRRLCEIYFIGSHKNQMRQFRYKFASTAKILFGNIFFTLQIYFPTKKTTIATVNHLIFFIISLFCRVLFVSSCSLNHINPHTIPLLNNPC